MFYSTTMDQCFISAAVQYVRRCDTTENLSQSVLIFTDSNVMRDFMKEYFGQAGRNIITTQAYILSHMRPERVNADGRFQDLQPMNDSDRIIIQAALSCQSLPLSTALSYINIIWQDLRMMAETEVQLFSIENTLKKSMDLWKRSNSTALLYAAQSLLTVLSKWPNFSFNNRTDFILKELTQKLQEWTKQNLKIYLIGMPKDRIMDVHMIKTFLTLKQDLLIPYMLPDTAGDTETPVQKWTSYYQILWKMFDLPKDCVCRALPVVTLATKDHQSVLSRPEWRSFIDIYDTFLPALNGQNTTRDHDQCVYQQEYEDENAELMGVAAYVARELKTSKNQIQVFLATKEHAKRLQYILAFMDIFTNVRYRARLSETVDGCAFIATANLIQKGVTPDAVFGFLKHNWIQANWSTAWKRSLTQLELRVRKQSFHMPFISQLDINMGTNGEFKSWMKRFLYFLGRAHAQYKIGKKVNLQQIFHNQLKILLWASHASIQVNDSHTDHPENHSENQFSKENFDNLDVSDIITKLRISSALQAFLHKLHMTVQSDMEMTQDDWFFYVKFLSNVEKLRSNTQYSSAERRISIRTGLSLPLYSGDTVICANMNDDSRYLNAKERKMQVMDSSLHYKQEGKHAHGQAMKDLRVHMQRLLNVSILNAKKVIMTRAGRNIHGERTLPHQFWLFVSSYAVKNGISLQMDSEFAQITSSMENHRRSLCGKNENLNTLPAPCPERKYRQNSISIKDISYLKTNPYVIFAKRILKLRELLNLNMRLTYCDRGTCFHAIMEQFCKGNRHDMESFTDIVHKNLLKWQCLPFVSFLWRKQFLNFGQWFIKYVLSWSMANVKEPWYEARGKYKIRELSLEIRGVADVIYRMLNGTYAIIDYKTGGIPSRISVEDGRERQLTIEALLLQHNSFAIEYDDKKSNGTQKSPDTNPFNTEDRPKSSVARLIYLGLRTGLWESPECTSFDLLTKDRQLLKTSTAGLYELLQHFYADLPSDQLKAFQAIDNGKDRDFVEDMYAHLMRLEGN